VSRNDRQQVVLRNPDGNVVQALPSRSDETAASAKKTLSDLKKELKQTVQQQTARLYEAMSAKATDIAIAKQVSLDRLVVAASVGIPQRPKRRLPPARH
jgi:hypothetical protein